MRIFALFGSQKATVDYCGGAGNYLVFSFVLSPDNKVKMLSHIRNKTTTDISVERIPDTGDEKIIWRLEMD